MACDLGHMRVNGRRRTVVVVVVAGIAAAVVVSSGTHFASRADAQKAQDIIVSASVSTD